MRRGDELIGIVRRVNIFKCDNLACVTPLEYIIYYYYSFYSVFHIRHLFLARNDR